MCSNKHPGPRVSIGFKGRSCLALPVRGVSLSSMLALLGLGRIVFVHSQDSSGIRYQRQRTARGDTFLSVLCCGPAAQSATSDIACSDMR
jgi:hypothetical protein